MFPGLFLNLPSFTNGAGNFQMAQIGFQMAHDLHHLCLCLRRCIEVVQLSFFVQKKTNIKPKALYSHNFLYIFDMLYEKISCILLLK